MTFSHEQIENVRQGQPVRINPPEIGAECVVVRADIFERVRPSLDDGLTMEQVAMLVAADMHADDQCDPLLASYERYRQ